MFPRPPILLPLVLAAALTGCDRHPPRPADVPAPGLATTDADYAIPPAVSAVRPDPAGPRLSGTAAPGVKVRLSAPGGAALFATADSDGRWSLRLPPSAGPRIFGLSEKVAGRQAQGQGYVVVTPEGPAALLRAGAGAVRLDPQRLPALGAVDFDNGGGLVISGVAPPSSLVFLRIDGRQVAEARVDAAGHYVIALTQPIGGGAHTLEVAGDTFVSRGQMEVARAAPLAAEPLRSQLTRGGRRIDWLTPGGGMQSTVLLD